MEDVEQPVLKQASPLCQSARMCLSLFACGGCDSMYRTQIWIVGASEPVFLDHRHQTSL